MKRKLINIFFVAGIISAIILAGLIIRYADCAIQRTYRENIRWKESWADRR